MKDVRIVTLDDPAMAGNWHPFPPPGPGFYHVRRVVRKDDGGAVVEFNSTLGPNPRTVPVWQGEYQFEYYANRRMHIQGNKDTGKFLIMGRRVSKLRASDGWQFQFLPSKTNYRPFVVLYNVAANGELQRDRTVDVTGQLPLARSIEEARYIVQSIPQRYPGFWKQHVEYTEEQLQ